MRQRTSASNIRDTFLVIVVALVVSAGLFSSGLVSAVYDLPPSDWSERAITVVETWHGWMEALGVAELSLWLADRVAELHAIGN